MNEGFVHSVIEALPQTQGVALDIGAHHGGYTTLLAEKFGTVYAFEPCPANIDALKGNVASKVNVYVIEKAIGATTGRGNLWTSDNPGGHTISEVVANRAQWGHKPDIWMPVDWVSIDDFMLEHGLVVDFIKCDVEGAENFIFKGGVRTLTHNKMDIMLEVHQTVECAELWQFFHDLGYSWTDCDRQQVDSIINDRHYLLTNK